MKKILAYGLLGLTLISAQAPIFAQTQDLEKTYTTVVERVCALLGMNSEHLTKEDMVVIINELEKEEVQEQLREDGIIKQGKINKT